MQALGIGTRVAVYQQKGLVLLRFWNGALSQARVTRQEARPRDDGDGLDVPVMQRAKKEKKKKSGGKGGRKKSSPSIISRHISTI